MKEQNIAKVYAHSFLQLATEHNFNVADELTKLTEVINTSNDLENVLFLDVFTTEEKIVFGFNSVLMKLILFTNDSLLRTMCELKDIFVTSFFLELKSKCYKISFYQ